MQSLPDRVGIMVLDGLVLFPHNLVPLRIFEPRYRNMLREALETHRMFALSIPDPDSPIRQPAQVAGLGLVRACVQNDDGTSNLILQGVARVRFPSFSRSTPLFEGQPIPLVTTGLESPKVKSLADEIVSHILGLARTGFTLPEGVEDLLKNLDNPDMLADIVAGTFLRDPQRKQELLETDHAEKRLALLAKTLKEELPHPKAM